LNAGASCLACGRIQYPARRPAAVSAGRGLLHAMRNGIAFVP
jgi:hypothetical protein